MLIVSRKSLEFRKFITMDTTHSSEEKVILRQLKDISKAVSRAAQADTLEQVLEQIAHVSRGLVNARYAAIGIPNDDGTLAHFKVSGISKERILKIGKPPTGKGLLGEIIQSREAIRLDNLAEHNNSSGFPLNHPPMTTFLGVPIQTNGDLLGSIYLCDRLDGQPFSTEDQWIIEVMASYVAMAITNSEVRDQQRRLTLLEERERIAMELHDGVIQTLYAVGMSLNVLKTKGMIADPDEMKPILATLDDAIEDIRLYIYKLSTASEIASSTFYEHIEEALGKLTIPSALTVSLTAPNEPPLLTPSGLENVMHIIFEAVSNVIRHSEATTLYINVEQNNKRVQVKIEDDGIGFEASRLNKHQGLGLANVKRRVEIVGGEIDFHSIIDQGTIISFHVPVII